MGRTLTQKYAWSLIEQNTREVNQTGHSTPKVSVCIPTYNHGRFIKDAVESALSQRTNFPFEIVIGDDCSTDETTKVVERYQEEYPEKIRLLLSTSNLGRFTGNGRLNFLRCLRACRGEYIAMLEGDDYWTKKDKLQRQVDIMESNNDIIVCHHWHRYGVVQDGEYVEVDAPTSNQGYLPRDVGTVRDMFANRLRVKLRSMMFRNIIHDAFFPGWFLEVAFGDVPLNFLLGKHGNYYFIDEPMAVYRQTGQGVSSRGKDVSSKEEWVEDHYTSWITIWDHANNHYKRQYGSEASKTIRYFYRLIMGSGSLSLRKFSRLCRYTLQERNADSMQKMSSLLYVKYRFAVELGLSLCRRALSLSRRASSSILETAVKKKTT